MVHVIGGGDTGGVMTHLVPLLEALRNTWNCGCSASVAAACRPGGGAGAGRGVVPVRSAFDPSMLASILGL